MIVDNAYVRYRSPIARRRGSELVCEGVSGSVMLSFMGIVIPLRKCFGKLRLMHFISFSPYPVKRESLGPRERQLPFGVSSVTRSIFGGERMARFIIASFGFLFWGFYEMSGGADFEPGWYIENKDGVEIAAVEETVLPKVEEEPVVTRADTRINDLGAVATAKPLVTPVSYNADGTQGARVLNVLYTQAEPIEVDVSEPEVVAAVANEVDLREVTASRVNLRNGPGTRYSVLDKLVRGDEVQVLSNNGDGWIKLRVKSSNQVGWMADYLVTASN